MVFKDVVVLSSLGAYVEPYGLAWFGYVSTVKAYGRHGLFHIAYGKSTNVRFWSITVPICLRYHAVLASGNVYAAADPLSFR